MSNGQVEEYISSFYGHEIDDSVGKRYLSGSTDPTTSTVGKLGQHYFNTSTKKDYICTGVSGSVFTWELVESQGEQGVPGQDGAPGQDGDDAIIYYGTCSTNAGTAAKTVSITGFGATQLVTGAIVGVKFSNANTNTSATLNVSNTGAKAIRANNASPVSGQIAAGTINLFQYDGSYWVHLNPISVDKSAVGANNGLATLDSNGKVTAEQATSRIVSVTANKTLALTDAGTIQQVSSTSNRTITVPENNSVAFPVGTEIEILKYNTGNVTVSGASGVTIRSADSKLSLEERYTVAALKKLETNEWLLVGALS